MTGQRMPQYVLVYGPPNEPTVYTTAAPDFDLARLQVYEAEQRVHEAVRITTADAVPVDAAAES
jgi:hypothetical protein